MPEMQIGRGRVEPRLDPQRHATPQLFPQVGRGQHFVCATLQLGYLFLEVHVVLVRRVLKRDQLVCNLLAVSSSCR